MTANEYATYVRQRVADTCAAQGVTAEPGREITDLVSAVLATKAVRHERTAA